MNPYVYVPHCQEWCASQFFHASTQHVILIFIAAAMLCAFYLFKMIWPNIENPPFSDDTAERIAGVLLTTALLMLVIFLVLHYFYVSPEHTAEMLNTFTPLHGDPQILGNLT